MDKLDYLLWAVALVLQGFLSLGVLYMYGGAHTEGDASKAMSALHQRLAQHEGATALDEKEARRSMELASAALRGMEDRIAQLTRLYRQAAIVGLLSLCFQGVVIWRLHARVRAKGKKGPGLDLPRET